MKACGNCVKYGAECPGYDKTLKFVTGKHAVRTRRPRGQGAASPHDTQIGLSSDPASDWERAASAVPGIQAGVQTRSRSLTRSRGRGRDHEFSRATVPGVLREECVPFVYNMMGELFSIHRREEVVFSTCLSWPGPPPPKP